MDRLSSSYHEYPDLFSNGRYIEIVQYRAANFGGALIGSIFQSVSVFAMFLLGLYMGKREFFTHTAAKQAVFKRWLSLGLLMGIPGNILYLWGAPLLSGIGFTLGATGLCFAYAGGLILLSMGASWAEWLRPYPSSLGDLHRVCIGQRRSQCL